ncbi:MAG TPA: flagellar export chaperone FliS [Myxococcota bacterium]|nr:flagellar export chaperone FliS [Myxococcota bacterium]
MGQRYREMEVRTASPETLVVLLYQGALRQARAAREHCEARRVAERGTAISKALAIVGELQSCLDFEQGGEIAQNLSRLYRFVCDKLVEANLGGRTQPIDEAVRVLETLCSAWVEIAQRPAAGTAAAR